MFSFTLSHLNVFIVETKIKNQTSYVYNSSKI